MKLKSKLIATIVSICAAIAVMGVGVWAATSSFTVTVTNNVNIEFTNLTGTVTVSATATLNGGAVDGIENITDREIYTAATSTNQAHTISSANTATNHTQWAGADLLTTKDGGTGYIDNTTTEAKIQYVFTYTPTGSGDAFTTVVINSTSEAKTNGGQIEYTYDISGLSTDVVKGTTYYAADDEAITVTITATYTNTNLVATQMVGDDTTWVFSVAFASALTAPTSGAAEIK